MDNLTAPIPPAAFVSYEEFIQELKNAGVEVYTNISFETWDNLIMKAHNNKGFSLWKKEDRDYSRTLQELKSFVEVVGIFEKPEEE